MYIPLNVKTNYNLLSSLNDIPHLIKKASMLNIKAIAITDSMMYGTMEFYKECLKNNIKPIIGQELEINDLKIYLYAMNYEGYQNLTRLIYLKQQASISLDILKEYSSNLICIIPLCSLELFSELHVIFKYLYLGYSNLNERTILLNKSKKVVFLNEILYINKGDDLYLKYLYLIKDNKRIDSIKEYNIDLNAYLMDEEEVISISNKEDFIWMEEIYNLCNIVFKANPHLLPKYDMQGDSKVYLHSLCKMGLEKRFNGNISPLYVDRLIYELGVISSMGFNDYFLVVYDFVKYAKNHNILIGPGRGSAAGSLVSYCLGITDVDPIKYNLLFERFLNPERITMPDIDIDFESIRRGEVVDYVINKYGKKRVAPIITFVTLGGKQAIRDVARIFEINSNIIDNLCKNVDLKYLLSENLKINPHLKSLLNSNVNLDKIYRIASFIEGAKRQISTHAAGIIICEQEIDSYIPLQKYDDYYITGFSMEHLEELGLLKIDFLGLRNLTLIEGVLKDIKESTNQELLFKDIPLDDKKVLELFANSLTEGVFQFESEGMKKFLIKLKPNSFEEIVAANALFRPGPMQNIDSYIKRKFGTEKIDYLHPDLTDILKPTYGIIVYQEQIMQIANRMAGYSYGEADILRRAMSKKKKEVLEGEKAKFIQKSIAKGYDEAIATKVYDLILKFADYGFNRAHSVAYSLIGYKMAYLKVYYPTYFMSNLLTNVIGNEAKTKIYIDECKIAGIKVYKPNINKSTYQYISEDEGIRFSLAAIHNVGMITCKEIIKARGEMLYTDFFDFVGRTYGRAVTRKTIESLIDADAFSTFNYNHQTLHHNIDNAINYAELVTKMDASLIEKPIMIIQDEMSRENLCEREVDAFGFYFSNHPTAFYKANDKTITNLIDISKYFDKEINVIVHVDKIKTINTKKNDEMAFITGSDETSTIDLVLFPSVYKDNQNITKGSIIKAKVKVEKRMSRYQLSVLKLLILLDI